MDTVRIARELGDVSTLLPEGVPLSDAPYNLVDSISIALRFLAFEKLPVEDQPPKRIWLDHERLKAWFEEVDRKRKERYGLSDRREESGPMMEQNAQSMLIAD